MCDHTLTFSAFPRLFSFIQGEERALVVSFNLPSSCYATMCLRELLKSPTTVAHQKVLEEAVRKEKEAKTALKTEVIPEKNDMELES